VPAYTAHAANLPPSPAMDQKPNYFSQNNLFANVPLISPYPCVVTDDAKAKAAKAAKAVSKGSGKQKLLKKRFSPTFHRRVPDVPKNRRFPARSRLRFTFAWT